MVAGLVMVLTFTLAAGLFTRGGEGGHKTLVTRLSAVTSRGASSMQCFTYWAASHSGAIAHAFCAEFNVLRTQTPPRTPYARNGSRYFSRLTREQDRERLYSAMRELVLNAKPLPAKLRRDDIKGAIAILIWLCNYGSGHLPVPVFAERWLALRVSNLLLVALLFLAGYPLGSLYRFESHIHGISPRCLGTCACRTCASR